MSCDILGLSLLNESAVRFLARRVKRARHHSDQRPTLRDMSGELAACAESIDCSFSVLTGPAAPSVSCDFNFQPNQKYSNNW